MSRDVTIKMKSGSIKTFIHESRPGGSYSIQVRYEGGFVVVKDTWDNQYAYPANDVEEVHVKEHARF